VRAPDAGPQHQAAPSALAIAHEKSSPTAIADAPPIDVASTTRGVAAPTVVPSPGASSPPQHAT
jgi:hypothetical protein